ncbi:MULTISPECIES: hypothetical protein [unclassified Exiguobacterium]|uniref:hypothetical protein n=1 Tax=Exiguobacterium TaxID=33986 RepID=UPI001BE4E99F|nr:MULTISPECIES: hypothetical protein [unclassified Exiguobacterium]MCK2157471.1 hypothetical protein [Exiguobacterium sp. 17-1]
MFEPKREFITTAETILFVSTLFIWLYIEQYFDIVDTWWWMLPVMTFVLFLRSFIGRRVDLSFGWNDDEEERELDQKQR